MSKLKIFLSESLNPHLNLATEEWIFHNLDPSSQVLFLWRNDNTVVIGRNQNPWSECNLAKMKEDQVTLARRTTGGGAVFHDMGNTNFTFLSPKESYRRENNIQIIFDALKTFGIKGEASGRNDLLIPFADGPRKFSGSAYREKKDRAFHHGTLLLHADLMRLGNYLTPNPKKLQAKGKESVRARVANLNEISANLKHEEIVEAMIKSFENFYGGKAETEFLSMKSLHENQELKGQYETLSSWNWLYGNTLEFNQKMDEYLSLGFFDIHFKVDEAVITDLQIFSDCLYPHLIEAMTLALKGKPYTVDSIQQSFAGLYPQFVDLTSGLKELEAWISSQVEI
ncbi:lipoate--protein ligase [Bdellovibrio svalbardensis]|uniref:lipoate--protein ligase n=1 Tax=Bdellovibrio svalbardensis TaxID=2972972 RepID=A0ABT6DNH6_9BACT|nr:lipoate--protein ligase [Bdellovibrio svalbardensis]MDG0817489.1 lipoate--protein ligase [Bdellovibrio svalbardensis]